MKAQDVVCGMDVEEDMSAYRAEWDGKPYYFCSKSCQDRFSRNAPVYIKDVPAKS
jgi:P-type Cu+ transporter